MCKQVRLVAWGASGISWWVGNMVMCSVSLDPSVRDDGFELMEHAYRLGWSVRLEHPNGEGSIAHRLTMSKEFTDDAELNTGVRELADSIHELLDPASKR
jgi:hypothetical protein